MGKTIWLSGGKSITGRIYYFGKGSEVGVGYACKKPEAGVL